MSNNVATDVVSNRDVGNQRSGALGASEVFDGAWKEIEHNGGIFVRYLSSHAPTAGEANTRIEFSDDGLAHNGVSAGIIQRTSGAFFIGTITVNGDRIGGKYYRVHYKNGTTPTTFTFIFAQTSKYLLNGTVGSISDPLSDLLQFQYVRAVLSGIQPDGDFVNHRADGLLFEDDTPLGAAGVFETDWFDTDGWSSAELFIATDAVSGSNGIEIEFTDDTSAAVPVVRGTRFYTFTAEDVAQGWFAAHFLMELDGLRVRYTNGGSVQSEFFIAMTLRTQPVSPQGGFEQELGPTNTALMSRGLVVAKNDSGAYGNVLRAALGGLRVAINEHEAATPIKALTNFAPNQSNVGTSAVQIVGSPLSGRKTVAIKALASNNAKVYVGLTGVTTGSGWELNSSESLIMEIDDTSPAIYAVAASGTQRVCWMEVA